MAHQEIRPQPGPQTEFLRSKAQIVVYGGAMGGGKTFGLLLEAARHIDKPDYGAVIFRRTYPEITNEGALWDTSMTIYPRIGGNPIESDHSWTFPSGAQVSFRHLEHEKTVHNWQGAQIPMFGLDEATSFTEKQFWYLLSRNRSMCQVKPYVRLTCNPDPDSYVAKLIDWWIGEDGFPIPERAGKIRWFVRVSGQLIWDDEKDELIRKTGCKPIAPKSLTFIPSTVYDNQILLDKNPEYLANLLAQDEIEQKRNLYGNWRIKHTGTYFRDPQFDDWPEDLQTIAVLDPAYGGSNHTALAIGGIRPPYIYVRGFVWNRSVTQKYNEILAILNRYGTGTLYVESNADKGFSARDLLRLRGAAVTPYPERENKHVRILTFVQKNWRFIRFAHDTERDFLNEIISYEEGKEPDDAPDAMAGLIRALTTARRREIKVGEVLL